MDLIPGSGRSPEKPTPVFLPGKSHGQRSLVGSSQWGQKESDTTESLSTNKDLLYVIGNSTQYSVKIYMGKESEKEWIYAYV